MTEPPSRNSSPPEVWRPAQRAVRAIATPVQNFLQIEAASGLLLLASIAVALVWANSSYAGSYHALWHLPVSFEIGDWSVSHPLHYWINDGLMTIFFFVVGLEIRRELYEGELSDVKRAALPLLAALGGVVVPALIYLAFNTGRAGAGGWAVPMATDIAFAVGVLTLLGSRVPHALRVLLLGLAVIDDIAAIVVIAVVFSSDMSLTGALIAAGGVGGVLALRAGGVRVPVLYILPGIAIWAGLAEAGIHPTLAGVLLGLLTPVLPWYGASGFKQTTEEHLQGLEGLDREQVLMHLDEINRARKEAVSPAERLIHSLHPWVAFVVMPVFAVANSGVDIGGGDLSGDGLWVFLGIVVGLAIGKPVGIAGASILSSRIGIAARSADMTGTGLALVGMVGGIGFTMSLFIANLAFPPGAMLETAKLAILVASAVAMIAGLAFGAARFSRTTR